MDAMKTKTPGQTFREQMAESMAELKGIIDRRESPTGNGKLSARVVEVVEPGAYDGDAVRDVREKLGVSQAVFARLVGVSDVLVRSWERGSRTPAEVARRLLDRMRERPAEFAKLVRVRKSA
jgi:DNA-binding transcriptional regulator YiaG